jgi:lipopolysaccharide/colanic/teichoic acid biosynthesis glycosyltransferase
MTNLSLFAVAGKAEGFGPLPAQPAPTRRAPAVAKRVTDVALGVVALLLFLPLMAFCAILIKLLSDGPIFYRQDRCGKDGRVFRMYKLRTMSPDAESETGPVWADDDDLRVVPCCRWMRRSHVDELPQIINVLLGQMSLVGPRPERPDILTDLTRSYPKTPQRLAVLPGITGLAQIRWKYDNVRESFNHKLKIDLEYIQRRSWLYDLYIILATIPKFVSISAPQDFAPVVRPATTPGRARRGEFQGFARQQLPRGTQTKKCG